MASVVQYTFSSNTNAFETDATEAVSFAASATVGNVIAVGIMASATNRTISSVSDEGGNTYTLVTNSNNEYASSGTEVWWYTAPVTTTAQTVTVAINSALASPARVVIVEVTAADTTTPVEDTAIADTNSTSHACGPITASGASVLLGIMFGTNGTYTNEASWTSMGSVTTGHAAYRAVTAGDYTWTPTTSGTEQTAMSLIAVAPAAAAASGAGPIFAGRALGLGRIVGGSALR